MSRSVRDTDKGFDLIRHEIALMAKKSVKVGIIEGAARTDGASMAQIGAWNEYGAPKRNIPSRPWLRGWIASRQSQINNTVLKLFKLVGAGQMDARTALGRLGQYAQDGIKAYIRNGSFVKNADSTIRQKKSSKPLIWSGQMRNSVRYQVVDHGPTGEGS